MSRHLPYSLKPEFVRGCTMRCVFCALRHQEWAEKEYKFIKRSLWEKYVAAVAEWRPKVRIEIANRGEPTLHPEFLSLIRIAREALPKAQIMVSTNGDLSLKIGLPAFKDYVKEAMDRGVNVFLLDCYTPKRLKEFTELFEGVAGTFFDDEKTGEAALNPYPYRGPDWKAISIKDAVPYREGAALFGTNLKPRENKILQYHNQGGQARVDGAAAAIYPTLAKPLETPLKRMCVRPMREMPMWMDGSVPICCDDWGDQAIVGKFPDMTLQELWDAYDPWRRQLVKRDRAGLTPCDKCNEREGQRFGLELGWFDGDNSVQSKRTAAKK